MANNKSKTQGDIVPRKTLEAAHANLKQMEQNVHDRALERRTSFFEGIQTKLGQEPPTAYSSVELADAYHAGAQFGVVAVFEEMDTIAAVITDGDEVVLNIGVGDSDELDISKIAHDWATYINN